MKNKFLKNRILAALLFMGALLLLSDISAQNIVLNKAISDSNYPKIIWRITGVEDIFDFQVFRSLPDGAGCKEIHTIHFVRPVENSDSLELVVIDTTLTEKGLYLYFIGIEQNGKSLYSDAAYGHNYGILPSPTVFNFVAQPASDTKAIVLSWELSYMETLTGIELFRSRSFDHGYEKVADLPCEARTYTDVVAVANEPWYYVLVLHDYFGRKISSQRIPAFATFAEKPVRPQNFQASIIRDSLMVRWTNAGNNIIGAKVYVSENDAGFRLFSGTLSNVADTAQYFFDIPSNTLRLSCFAVNVSDGFVESSPSDTMSFYIAANDVLAPPSQADCFIRSDGFYTILWTPPTQGEPVGYNIYISDQSSEMHRLNEQPIVTNSFTDTVFRSAGKYIYSIETVGINGLKSAKMLPKVVYRRYPQISVMLDLKRKGDGVEVSWLKPTNRFIRSLTLIRLNEDGSSSSLITSTDDHVTFVDKNVERSGLYLYKLVAGLIDGSEQEVNDGVSIIW